MYGTQKYWTQNDWTLMVGHKWPDTNVLYTNVRESNSGVCDRIRSRNFFQLRVHSLHKQSVFVSHMNTHLVPTVPNTAVAQKGSRIASS